MFNETNRKVGQRANLEVGSQKTKLKKVKSSIKLQNVFRRVSQGSKSGGANGDSDYEHAKKMKMKGGKLFGLNLDDVCENANLPKAIEVSGILHI